MKTDLDELEQLSRKATSLPWEMVDARAFLDDEDFEIRNGGHCIGYGTDEKDAAYIIASCNAVPELIRMVRELEKEKEQLLGVIGSMHSLMKQRNNMAINLVTVLHDAMNKQFLNAMDESLTQSFTLIQEALDARP